VRPKSLKAWCIFLAMVIGAGLADAAKPRMKVADSHNAIELAAIVPREFGSWRIDASIVPVAPAPDVQAKLNQLYNQVLTRTYVNDGGDRIMLSVAYGGDQSDAMQVHRPEICYAAQGFQVSKVVRSQLPTEFGILPIQRVLAQLGARTEPITYWVTVGSKASYPGLEQKLLQLRFGLAGEIPDGMLFRVSSISRDENSAYELQGEFVRSMLMAMNGAQRERLGMGSNEK
jgi:EpsI family protein